MYWWQIDIQSSNAAEILVQEIQGNLQEKWGKTIYKTGQGRIGSNWKIIGLD